MTTKPDARRHPRFAVRIKAEVCTAAGDVSAAITKDLSRGGICLVCPLEVQAGSALDLSLALVLGTNTFSEKLAVADTSVTSTCIPGTLGSTEPETMRGSPFLTMMSLRDPET